MKFISKKSFYSPRFGNVVPGQVLELDKNIAKKMVDSDFVELSSDEAERLKGADKKLFSEEVKKESK